MTIPDSEHQRHIADLEAFQGILEQLNFDTQLVPHGDRAPISYLSVTLPKEIVEEPTALRLMYIPSPGMAGEISLLQVFAFVTGSMKEIRKEVRDFIDFLQTRNPIGYFGITPENHIFYRYVYTYPKYKAPEEPAFLDMIDLFIRTYARFGATVEELIRRDIDFATACRRITG